MGNLYRKFLDGDGHAKVYACQKCNTHLSFAESVESKSFTGHYGRAWLFREVHNITIGEPEDKTLTTGLHTIQDIACVKCGAAVGWKYKKAFETSQHYKVGKYILERALICDIVVEPPLQQPPTSPSSSVASSSSSSRASNRSRSSTASADSLTGDNHDFVTSASFWH